MSYRHFFLFCFFYAVSPANAQVSQPFSITTNDLPAYEVLENQILASMPIIDDVAFNPILIERYRESLESFRENEIVRFEAIMDARCKYILRQDAQIRNDRIPSEFSWRQYDAIIVPYINSELNRCSLESKTSRYASLYRRVIDQYESYIDGYQLMIRRCNNSGSCSVVKS